MQDGESVVIPPIYERRATVGRVIDGDTLRVQADLGCDITVAMTVRLAGVNAPELSTTAGKAAKAYVEQWVATNGPTFRIRTAKDRKEKYGRYLADLLPMLEGGSLCDALLASGNAVPYLADRT